MRSEERGPTLNPPLWSHLHRIETRRRRRRKGIRKEASSTRNKRMKQSRRKEIRMDMQEAT